MARSLSRVVVLSVVLTHTGPQITLTCELTFCSHSAHNTCDSSHTRQIVYEEAAAAALRTQATLDRQQLKATLLDDQGLPVPLSLQEELTALARRAEAADERAVTAANEAKRATEDVTALKQQLATKPRSRGASAGAATTTGSAGSFF